MFNWHAGFLTVIYQRQYIDSAQRFPDAPRLTANHIEALDLFDRWQTIPRLHFSMRLERGDMQFVYNHSLLHDRTSFIDWPESDRRRHMLRLWLSVPGDRPLPECFVQRYGSIRSVIVVALWSVASRNHEIEPYDHTLFNTLGHSMRRCLSVLKAHLTVIASVLAVSSAIAQVPMSKEGTPGWYRMRLGQFEITALSDGTLELPADKLFTKVSAARIRSLLSRAYLSNEVTLTVNAFLVNTGTRLVLIDTGTGTSQMFGPKLGSLLSNLRASGYSPEQVDEIYVTHMHTDHIGGLTRDGQASFTNAIVRANCTRSRFLPKPIQIGCGAVDDKEDFESAMTIFKPYIAASSSNPFTAKPNWFRECARYRRQGIPRAIRSTPSRVEARSC